MGRQTALPGVFIDSIEVETPPFDEPGVIQEYVGRGVTRDFELWEKASDITAGNVQEWIDDAEDMIGPFRDSYKIKYNLIINAAKLPTFFTKINKRRVSIRARSFVRFKNPFEPDVIEVSRPVLNEDLSGEEIGSVYNVSVTVTK